MIKLWSAVLLRYVTFWLVYALYPAASRIAWDQLRLDWIDWIGESSCTCIIP